MANTTNLNLVKPAGTDYALVSVINGNMDIIDSKVGAIPANESAQSQITALNNQIGAFSFVQLPSGTHTLDYALSLPAPGYKFFSLSGSSAYGGDLPSDNFKWGMGIIISRMNQSRTVIMFAAGKKPALNAYNESSWGGWKDFSGNAYA